MTVIAAVAIGFGCSPEPVEVSLVASETVEVSVRPSPTEGRDVVEWTIRHAHQNWTIRSRIPGLKVADLAAPESREKLQGQIRQDPAYLFIREDNGTREGSRSVVDHVFKLSTNSVTRLGTLSGLTGPPGSQWTNGCFVDTYDRLEFSPLSAHGQGPTFPIFIRDTHGRFVVDMARTWTNSLELFQRNLAHLTTEAAKPRSSTNIFEAPASIVARELRSKALFGLALTRYCGKSAEYDHSLQAARAALPRVDDLIEEAQTVVPGELAASRDEVLRANPALVNLFKESPDQPQEPETSGSSLPPPGQPLLNIPPL